jgi:hypothetical protein
MCNRLNDNDKSFASLIAIYSTREHPFGLVFKFMDQLNLRGYLRKNQDIFRLELVRFRRPTCRFRLSHRFNTSYWK